MSVQYSNPPGYPTVVPSLTIKGALEAIDFYQRVFGAKQKYCLLDKTGKIVMHAELQLGDAVIMLSDEFPQWGCLSPKSVGGCPSALRLFVDDVDAVHDSAVAAGATSQMAPADQFYGERGAVVEDPFGYRWSLAKLIEQVPEDEIERRMRKMEEDGLF